MNEQWNKQNLSYLYSGEQPTTCSNGCFITQYNYNEIKFCPNCGVKIEHLNGKDVSKLTKEMGINIDDINDINNLYRLVEKGYKEMITGTGFNILDHKLGTTFEVAYGNLHTSFDTDEIWWKIQKYYEDGNSLTKLIKSISAQIERVHIAFYEDFENDLLQVIDHHVKRNFEQFKKIFMDI